MFANTKPRNLVKPVKEPAIEIVSSQVLLNVVKPSGTFKGLSIVLEPYFSFRTVEKILGVTWLSGACGGGSIVVAASAGASSHVFFMFFLSFLLLCGSIGFAIMAALQFLPETHADS